MSLNNINKRSRSPSLDQASQGGGGASFIMLRHVSVGSFGEQIFLFRQATPKPKTRVKEDLMKQEMNGTTQICCKEIFLTLNKGKDGMSMSEINGAPNSLRSQR